MSTRSEIKNAILKGLGLRPTSFLLRWSPSLRKPLNFDLVEVSRCSADRGVVTRTMSQPSFAAHAGHKILSPNYFSLWEFLKVQLRWIA